MVYNDYSYLCSSSLQTLPAYRSCNLDHGCLSSHLNPPIGFLGISVTNLCPSIPSISTRFMPKAAVPTAPLGPVRELLFLRACNFLTWLFLCAIPQLAPFLCEISSWSVRPLALRSCKLCVRYCSVLGHATFSHGSFSAPAPARTGASLCEIVRLLALACEICSWLCKCNCNHAAGSFSVRDLLFFAYATFSHGSFSARSRTCWNWLFSVRDCAITSSGLRNLLLSLYLGTSCNGL